MGIWIFKEKIEKLINFRRSIRLQMNDKLDLLTCFSSQRFGQRTKFFLPLVSLIEWRLAYWRKNFRCYSAPHFSLRIATLFEISWFLFLV